MLGGKRRTRKVPWSYSYLWDAWTKGLHDDNDDGNDHNNRVDWQRIIRQVRRKPWVASFHDHERRGMVLLHLACAMNPPLEAIQAILEANPAAIRHRGYTGLVPLHIACGRNMRPDVLRVLLLQQKDGGKSTLLETRDNDGMMPIHYACRSDVHHEIMRILLTVQPKLATVQEGDRNMQRASIRPPLNTLSPLTILYNDQGAATPDHDNNMFGRWNSNQWNKLKDFVCAAHMGTIVPRNKQTVSILHASLALQCPADVVRVALKIQGEDAVQCGVRDVHGNLPLHYAVSSKALNNDDDDGRLLSTILHKFPPGASTRDAFARLPLHEGLKSGKRWSDGLADIYQQYPAAVTIPDRTTEQLAVVLAAEFSDLDATYATLRSYPQAIKMLLT